MTEKDPDQEPEEPQEPRELVMIEMEDSSNIDVHENYVRGMGLIRGRRNTGIDIARNVIDRYGQIPPEEFKAMWANGETRAEIQDEVQRIQDQDQREEPQRQGQGGTSFQVPEKLFELRERWRQREAEKAEDEPPAESP